MTKAMSWYWKAAAWVSIVALTSGVVMLVTARKNAVRLPTAQTAAASPTQAKVRPPGVAGGFYKADAAQLRKQVEDFLAAAKPPKLQGRLVALIVPHAGYDFAGSTAAFAFKLLQGHKYDTVVVVGPSHHRAFAGAAVTDSDAWATPLGNVPVDRTLCSRLLAASPRLRADDALHRGEHSIEVELPFLQVVLGDFQFCPVEVQDFSQMNCDAVADALVEALGDRNALLIASSDMSHFPATDDAAKVDADTLQVIKQMNPQRLSEWEIEALEQGVPGLECTLCGLGPVRIVMRAAIRLGADTAQVLAYTNSGRIDPRTAGRSVGYGAVALVDTGPDRRAAELDSVNLGELVSRQDQKQLLKIARTSLESYVRQHKIPHVTATSPALRRPRAVFVTLTLKHNGALRGCVGSFEPHSSLAQAVNIGVLAAAFRDPRFPPVTAGELDDIQISISILSPMRRIKDAGEIKLGKHGIVVCRGDREGVFLPEVAVEQGWDLETTLRELCVEKAHLPADAWQQPGTELWVFTTQHFSEADFA